MKRARLSLVPRLLFGALVVACACSAESEQAVLDVPPPDGFAPVSTALGRRCGTLECHGRAGQNLRLYGAFGLRLAPEDLPGGEDTTQLEHDANYQSVVSLEPETLSRVWQQGGLEPDRLTLVRKAKGAEEHTGGTVFPVDDPGNACIASWLTGATDEGACASAAELLTSPFEP